MMLEQALKYASLGLHVFPLAPRSKIPLIKGAGGVASATIDENQIRAWWGQNPDANIGIALGEISGVIALDVDKNHGATDKDISRFPTTVTTRTANGYHLYFAWYPGCTNRVLIPGTDGEAAIYCRAKGYYVVGAGSIHPTGFEYSAEDHKGYPDGLRFGEIKPAELPECFREIGTTRKESGNHGTDSRRHSQTDRQVLKQYGENTRHDHLKNAAVAMRKRGKNLEKIVTELHKENELRCNPPKENADKEIEGIASWAVANVLVDAVVVPPIGGGWRDWNGGIGKMPQDLVNQLAAEILDIRFKILKNETSSIVYNIKDIDKKEVLICHNDEYIIGRLQQNIIELTRQTPSPIFLSKMLVAWRQATKTLDAEPSSFLWQDQDGWTFKKLDFTPQEGNFDSWKEFLYRMSAPEDFMAFIWSIFEPQSRSRQYLYLFDPAGQGGKSTMINVLGEIFGNAFSAINNSFVNGGAARWLLGNLYGKRLVAWPDVKNTKFCMTETLRNITSGDNVTVEFKGEKPFTTRMYVKLIMASNHEPMITSGGADSSRLIRIDLKENKVSKNDPEWKDRIKAELPYFLWECRKHYQEKCKNHGDIKITQGTMDLVDSSTEGIESRFEDIVKRRITFEPNATNTVTDWIDFCQKENLTDHDIANFKDYLRKLGSHVFIGKRRVGDRALDRKASVYEGFKISYVSNIA